MLTIVCDSREQNSLSFHGFRGVKTVRSGLKTGDYSIQGYEDQITFERKSVQDLVGTLIGGHERFLREMERMRAYKVRYILIEHSPEVLYMYCARHGWQRKFNTIIQSLLAYACHYQVRVRFCKDREDMTSYIVKKSKEFINKEGGNDSENQQ